MVWKNIPGTEVMDALQLNNVPLSSERHSPLALTQNADALPTTSGAKQEGGRKTSLTSLGS